MKLPKFKIPTCPFCGRPIEKPKLLPIGFSDFEAGVCECGSVYVCDVTGKNRGAAFVEALVIACGGNWDLAWELSPDEDYKEIWVENYDLENHRVIELPAGEKKRLRSALCFIKLARDLEELRDPELKKSLKKKEVPEIPPKKKRLRRQEIEALVKEGNLQELISYHLGEPLNLHTFQKLLYHPDPLLRKKAGVYLGMVAKALVDVYPEKVLDLIKRLIYAAADSAASPWGAIEAVGEILRNTGDRYALFVNNLFAFLPYPEYTLYVLYAFYRISELYPELIKRGPYLRLLKLLEKEITPEAKALIYLIFKNLKAKEILSYLSEDGQGQIFNYQKMMYEEFDLKELAEKVKEELSK